MRTGRALRSPLSIAVSCSRVSAALPRGATPRSSSAVPFSTAAAARQRNVVVTGAASGIGKATVDILRANGAAPIGVDAKAMPGYVDVQVDLASPSDRARLADLVRAKIAPGGTLDGVVANAGSAAPNRTCVTVNYFGALATLQNLRPLLAKSPAPRAAITLSIAAMMPVDRKLMATMLSGDEAKAIAMADEMEKDPVAAQNLYATSKHALGMWMRRNALSPAWKDIPMNAVGPTVIDTPMVAPLLGSEDMQKVMHGMVPGKWGKPEDIGHVLAFLVSQGNALMHGQLIFVDGGYDVLKRKDDIWPDELFEHGIYGADDDMLKTSTALRGH